VNDTPLKKIVLPFVFGIGFFPLQNAANPLEQKNAHVCTLLFQVVIALRNSEETGDGFIT